MMTRLDSQEARALCQLALGRILRLASRPSAPGDVEQYERCRALMAEALDVLGFGPPSDDQPNWVRDRLRGVQGD